MKSSKYNFLLVGSLLIMSNEANSQNNYQFINTTDNSSGISQSNTPKMASDDLFNIAIVKNINSKNSEFGGYPLGEKTFYCSSKNLLGPIKRIDGNTGKPLYNLYSASKKENSLTEFKLTEKLKNIHSGPVCATPDQKYLFLTADNTKKIGKKGVKKLQLYRATVMNDLSLSDLELLPFNSNDYSTGHPAISKDGKTLFFASDMPGGLGGVDLYKVAINEDGSFGTPENLGAEVNSSANEMFPWIAEDGILLFASNGHGGFGGLDLFAVYPNKEKWYYLTNLGTSINTAFDDFALILNADGTGYYSSNRNDGLGDDDIYSVVSKETLKLNFQVKGLVSDKSDKTPIEGVSVKLIDKDGKELKSTTTGKDGSYSFDVNPDENYSIAYASDSHLDKTETVYTGNITNGKPLVVDASLEKNPKIALYALVTDRKTSKPLENVLIKITDNITGKEVGSYTTSNKGDIFQSLSGKKVGDRVSYNIVIEKEGYISSTQTYNAEIKKEGQINLHEQLNFALVFVNENQDLGKLIDLKPIYFDYNKFVIRLDAAIELDKIVKIMNENPDMVIELGAHTDARGAAPANLTLSEKRAQACTKYIKERIVKQERITGKGYGESVLLNACKDGVKCSDDQHSVNRRTEFKIISFGTKK